MLTPKQETFVLEYMKTGNASEAYRQAYDVQNMNSNSINRKAKDLIDNVKIRARLSELTKPARKEAQITLVSHLEDLKRLRDLATDSEKYGPAIQAEMARGKASGLYIDRTEITGKDGMAIKLENVGFDKLSALISNLELRKRAGED